MMIRTWQPFWRTTYDLTMRKKGKTTSVVMILKFVDCFLLNKYEIR